MRLLGELADRTAVRRVCDYLLTQGVRTQIDDGADKATVWVIDEDRVAAAKTVWAEFLADPSAEKYAQAETAAREIVSREVRRQRDRQQLIRDVRSQWEPVHGSTAVTWSVIALCVGMFLALLGDRRELGRRNLESSTILQSLSIEMYGPLAKPDEVGQLAQIRRGEVWRLVSPAFMHIELYHLVFNLFLWQGLAAYFEPRRGSLRLLLLVLVTAVASNLLQFYWPWSPGPRFLGLSGVVYGLVAYMAVKSATDRRSGLMIPGNLVVLSFVWLVLGLTGVVPHVANGAHLGGVLAGALLGYTPQTGARRDQPGD